jgi:outer membrane protein assembly factor BamE (lipoprotein component of BamABCDE complex)
MTYKNAKKFLMIGLFIPSLFGCMSSIDMRGNKPLDNFLSEIKPNQRMTKSDVVSLIGSPATTSAFDDNHWYYISATFESFAFYAPQEQDRQVVVIDFDPYGCVTDVHKLTLADGQDVAMNSKITPTQGKDLSLLAQIFGNVGRYNQSLKDKKSSP